MFVKYDDRKKGYTLAEMLVVMVIFTLMMLAMPPMAKKMFKLDTTPKTHGRFECFYGQDGILYQVNDNNISQSEHSGYCEFTPPSNTTYIMLHAVGGGGAGYNVTTEPDTNSDNSAISYLSKSVVTLWPDWFKYIHDSRNSLNLTFDNSAFQVKKQFSSVTLPYGVSGSAGQRVSMLFPRLRNVTIKVVPGKGGTVGNSSGNGEDTNIYLKYGNSSYLTTPDIVASGGAGGTSEGVYSVALAGGTVATDYGVGNLSAVKTKDSEFQTVLEDAGDDSSSYINKDNGYWGNIPAGQGGNGSYYIVYKDDDKYDSKFIYQINNYSERTLSNNSVERTSYWRTVTEKLPLSFYKRNGESSNCTNTETSPISVSAWCKANTDASYRSEYPYICSLSYDCDESASSGPNVCGRKKIYVVINKNGQMCRANNYNSSSNSTIAPTSSSSYYCVNATQSSKGSPNWDTMYYKFATYYQNCVFDGSFGNNLTCETKDFKPKYHKCSYTNSATLSSFDKENGGTGCIAGRQGNKCNASDGGNGAVVILW